MVGCEAMEGKGERGKGKGEMGKWDRGKGSREGQIGFVSVLCFSRLVITGGGESLATA